MLSMVSANFAPGCASATGWGPAMVRQRRLQSRLRRECTQLLYSIPLVVALCNHTGFLAERRISMRADQGLSSINRCRLTASGTLKGPSFHRLVPSRSGPPGIRCWQAQRPLSKCLGWKKDALISAAFPFHLSITNFYRSRSRCSCCDHRTSTPNIGHTAPIRQIGLNPY